MYTGPPSLDITYIVHNYTQTHIHTNTLAHARTNTRHAHIFRPVCFGFRPLDDEFSHHPRASIRLAVIRPGSGLDRYVWTDEKKANEREKKHDKSI